MSISEQLKPESKKFIEEINKSTKIPTPIRCKNEKPAQSWFYEIENNEIVILNLANAQIFEIPESIGYLKFLKFLNLNGNGNLSKLPKAMAKLNVLSELILDGVSLESVPDWIGDLKSLQKLSMEGIKLASLPKSIGDLNSLKELNLNNNRLISIPNSIGKLSSLQILNLGNNKIATLPDSIGNLSSLKILDLKRNFITILSKNFCSLKSLEKLDLKGNKITTLPEDFGKLTSLQSLIFESHQLTSIPDSIGNLSSLQELILLGSFTLNEIPASIGDLDKLSYLDIGRNKIKALPESFKNLKNLKSFSCSENALTEIGDWIGELKSLEQLSFAKNELKTLPRSIGQLSNLTFLNIFSNKFSSIPVTIWPLKKLTKLELGDNPWDQESKGIVSKSIPLILEYCRKHASMNVFLSHAVVDFNYFKIKELSDYLEQQNEINIAYYCEEDLKGNIDNFMNDNVPDSQLVLFFASKKSVLNSIDCAHELDLARQHDKQIIPIKGKDVGWGDLAKINLSRQLGFEYNDEDFETFKINLFNYIQKFKHDVDLFEPGYAKIDRQKFAFKNSVESLAESEDFKKYIRENLKDFDSAFEDLSNKKISKIEYYLKIGQLLDKYKKMN